MAKSINVEEALPQIESCPGCKYVYTTDTLTYGSNATALTNEQLATLNTNYEDVVSASGKPYFLGVKVNSSTNVVEKAYACGIKDGVPFCIEGRKSADMTMDIYIANTALLQSASLWNNGCNDYGSLVDCNGSVNARAYDDGRVNVDVGGSRCNADDYGILRCSE